MKYCSQAVQRKHWPEHKVLCTAISHLSIKAGVKMLNHSDSTFVTHLTPQQHATVEGLVGKRCTVKGEINGHSSEVLWLTGAQVSIMSNEFLRKKFPDVVVKDISELLNNKLSLTAANGSEIPYIGWVELNFRLSSGNNELKVPFLVTEQFLDSPLIGFNVIEEIEDVALSQSTASSFTDLDCQTASVFVNFIQGLNQEEICSIKTTKRDITIPANHSQKVTCRANTGPVGRATPVLFEPDEANRWSSGLEVSETLLSVRKEKSSQVDIDIINNTNHAKVLRGRTLLGRLQLVQSVTPVEVKLKEPDNSNNCTLQKETQESGTTKPGQALDEEPGGVPMGTQASVQSERPLGIPTHIKDMDL